MLINLVPKIWAKTSYTKFSIIRSNFWKSKCGFWCWASTVNESCVDSSEKKPSKVLGRLQLVYWYELELDLYNIESKSRQHQCKSVVITIKYDRFYIDEHFSAVCSKQPVKPSRDFVCSRESWIFLKIFHISTLLHYVLEGTVVNTWFLATAC